MCKLAKRGFGGFGLPQAFKPRGTGLTVFAQSWRRLQFGKLLMALGCALVLGAVAFALLSQSEDPVDGGGLRAAETAATGDPLASTGSTATTAAPQASELAPPATPVAVTGVGRNAREGTETRLPLPRFVSLKAERVNVRRGPSSEHQIAWVFTKKGLPVEIVAEFEQWRRIRDSEGSEGWVFHSMLTGKRTAMVAPWKKNRSVPLRTAAEHNAATVALARPGVIADIDSCNGSWCELTAGGYTGYVEQSMLWGVYPGEQIGN
jgi:SH3-like domain-containing protein